MPELLWTPDVATIEGCNLTAYTRWLERERGLRFGSYDELWRWSTDDLEAFWSSIWDHFGVAASRRFERVLGRDAMPGAQWFEGARLNWAEQPFAHARGERAAVIGSDERGVVRELSWDQIAHDVASLAATLRGLGVRPGDRVAAYVPNIPEAVVGVLACAAIGAVWCACAPDFGTASVLARFGQLDPKVLIATDGYRFGGRDHDRRRQIAALRAELPSVTHEIRVRNLGTGPAPDAIDWEEAVGRDEALEFEQLPADHPLWVLYSSGTTGIPKGVVHGHSGIVAEQHAFQGLHLDLRPSDRFFFYGSTSWVVWNIVVGALATGATIVVHDGSPLHPGPDALWELAARLDVTVLGVGSSYAVACQKSGIEPGRDHDLSKVRALNVTGSPLPAAGWRWVYEHVKADTWLGAPCGGTELCGAIFSAVPTLPVHAGEIECRCLGVAADAWDDHARPVVGEVGELVVTRPMPSMPLRLWGDDGDERYAATYFDVFPGVWRHGDWVTMTVRGSAIVHGRSDATINRQGVRMGSGEIYDAVEALAEVCDSLVVGAELPNGDYLMPLFVVLGDDVGLDDELEGRIRAAIRAAASPRHVPDEIVQVAAIPHTMTGKKLEVPVKRMLMGVPADQAANRGSVDNPAALDWFAEFAAERHAAAAAAVPG